MPLLTRFITLIGCIGSRARDRGVAHHDVRSWSYELVQLKAIVSEIDPDALVFISRGEAAHETN